eukprot:snap_masked-scaffold_1-processed-gene-24.29-mRNA-1 protein AED:0.18 eAED:0.20 QI:0/-1/0/1/-1/1/1/0/342
MPFNNPSFELRGNLTVQNSSTVICLRQKKNVSSSSVRKVDRGAFLRAYLSNPKHTEDNFNKIFHNVFEGFFSDKVGGYEFLNNWEILMGQSECINYLKSEKTKLRTMRYAGELKLPGGNVDEGESFEQCAVRELKEEFLIEEDCENIVLRPYSVHQTRPIRSKSNLMHNFVCLEEENKFLQELDIQDVNKKLFMKRKTFFKSLQSEKYWSLGVQDKEEISPEVHKIMWMDLDEVILQCFASAFPGIFVNDFQRAQFKLLGKKRRDPMFLTGFTLCSVDIFQNSKILSEFCKKQNMTILSRNGQIFQSGMSAQDVEQSLGRLQFPTFHPNQIKKRRENLKAKL